MSKIIRIKNNGGVIIAGELIEGNSKLSIDITGNVLVDEFEEGIAFSMGGIGGNDLSAIDFEENSVIL